MSQRVIEGQKGQNPLKIHLEKELKSKIDLLGLKARQGVDFCQKTRQDKKLTRPKQVIKDEDNEKNDLEKIIVLQEQDKDKELQHIFSEITGNEGTGPDTGPVHWVRQLKRFGNPN